MTDTNDFEDYIEHCEMIDNMAKALCQREGRNHKLITYIKDAGVKNPERAARSACKLICFYIELFVKNLTMLDFTTFIKECIDNGFVRAEDFWLNSTQADMLKHFCPSASFNETYSYDEYIRLVKKGRFMGTVRIFTGLTDNGKKKKHSIISYSDPATRIPVLADTSYRGIHEPVDKHIDKDNFSYFTYLTSGVKIA